MVSVSTEKKKNNNELINLRTDARVREDKKSLAGWTVLFVCFDYLVALVSLVTMIVIVFSPPRCHYECDSWPPSVAGANPRPRALAMGSRREPRQLKKYSRSRRQVKISEGVSRYNASEARCHT